MVTREPGVLAGVDIALLVLDEVLGADGYRVDRPGRRTAPAGRRRRRCWRVEAADARAAHRRAHRAEPGLPPVRHRHRHRGLGGRGRRHRAPRSATPARRCPGCGRCRSTRCAAAAGSTTGMGLGDAALIKDNHVAAAGSVLAPRCAQSAPPRPDLPCEVEVDSLDQLDEVLAEGVRAGAAGQLPGLADADRGAAPGRAFARDEAGVLGRAVAGAAPRTTPGPASTTSPSARSPTRCGCSIWVWIYES